jgi:carbon-monoxide dehydrogenase medium subunit
MIGSDFVLHRPDALEDAVRLRAELGEDAVLYAGGTELLLVLKLGVIDVEHLIDLKRCGLGGIDRTADAVRIGATTTHREIERDPVVAAHVPALSELARNVANVRVRSAGTLGGNLAFAEPHADPPALLAALDARVELAGPAGRRWLTIEEFLLDAFETALEPDEIMTAVTIPLAAEGVRAAYRKIAILERPTVGVAVAGRLEGGRFADAPAVVVGAVDERPIRVEAGMLTGASADDEDAVDAIAAAARDAVDPVDDLSGSADYKRHLTEVMTRRTVQELARSEGAA